MKQGNDNRFLKVTVLLLIVVNAVVLFFHIRLLMADNDRRPHPDRLKNRLIHDLKLDETQERAYSDMVEDHRAAMQNLRRQEEKIRTQLYAQPGNDSTDRQPFYDSLGRFRAERERVTFEHFSELRSILRPEQAEVFDRIIGEAVNGMEPGPPKR